MPVLLTIPDNYGWVALAATSTFFLSAYQMENVGSARKAAGIKYPQLYAEKAETISSPAALKFNCAQRAHQNTLESLPLVLFTTLLSGAYYPLTAASLCGVWVAGRIGYTIGYSTGVPAKRNSYGGHVAMLAAIGLGIASTVMSVQMILGI